MSKSDMGGHGHLSGEAVQSAALGTFPIPDPPDRSGCDIRTETVLSTTAPDSSAPDTAAIRKLKLKITLSPNHGTILHDTG